jgi:hypothetical protein
MKNFSLKAILLAVSIALPVSAQVSASNGDLILGFRANGGQGQNVNLEVNLGSVSQFKGLASGSTQIISRLSVADLIATYGSGWATRTDLFWGIVGTAGRVSKGPGGESIATLWATRAQEVVGTQSTAWTPGSRNAQFSASSVIETLYQGAPGSLNGAKSSTNSANAASINATLAGSYGYQDSYQNGVSFGFFNPTINDYVLADASGYAVSDLYESQPDSASSTYLGSFGLSSSGALIFSTSASYFASNAGAPTITTQPVSQAVASGSNASFSVVATGSGLTYQWYKNDAAISGATSSTLTLTAVTTLNAGNYSVKVTNASGASITATGFALSIGVANPGRLSNLSVLTQMAAGDAFTFGYVIGGAGTQGNKPMLMRASGPTLSYLKYFSASEVLADPTVKFYGGSTLISQNSGWANDQNIVTANTVTGAFPFQTDAKDSAVYVSAAPIGQDSLVIQGASSTSAGWTLAEVYDATPLSQFDATTPRLLNVSVLKNVGPSITVGFTVSGSSKVQLLIRAAGPTLGSTFNYAGAMADPKMSLYSGQTVIASNDDWGTPVGTGAATASEITAATTRTAPWALASGGKDSALLVSLGAGGYTVQVTAATGSTGSALIEIYEVPGL